MFRKVIHGLAGKKTNGQKLRISRECGLTKKVARVVLAPLLPYEIGGNIWTGVHNRPGQKRLPV